MSVSVQRTIVVVFFSSLFVLGISIYGDYGISWDEHAHRYFGIVSAYYINQIFGLVPTEEILNWGGETREIPALLESYTYRHYGVFFDVVLVGFEYLFDLSIREVYLLRHLFIFVIFFIGVIFFYLTISRVFNNRLLAILGCLLLVTSPRIFAHSFYDVKDIATLTLSVTSIYTLVRLLENPTLAMAVLHALSIGLFIDTRVAGIYLPLVTLLFLSFEGLRNYKSGKKLLRLCGVSFVFVVSLGMFVYLFWPTLWEQPLESFMSAIKDMGNYADEHDYDAEMVYMGDFISVRNVPWHYLPVWIGVTTPVLYSGLFLIGVSTILYRLGKTQRLLTSDGVERFGHLVLLLFFGPIVAVIAANSMLMDGWRHLYFCYPAFLLVGIFGLNYLIRSASLVNATKKQQLIKLFGILVILLCVISTARNMIINHPYQHSYFSLLAGKNIAKNWELDYWGLSFRQALEHVLAVDDSPRIDISVSSFPGKANLKILKKNDRLRLNIVDEAEAKYHLSNYRYRKEYERVHRKHPSFDNEIFSIEVSSILDRYKIMGVYRLK